MHSCRIIVLSTPRSCNDPDYTSEPPSCPTLRLREAGARISPMSGPDFFVVFGVFRGETGQLRRS